MVAIAPVVAVFQATTPEIVSNKLAGKCISAGETVPVRTPGEVVCHWGVPGDGETRYILVARGRDTVVQGLALIYTPSSVTADYSATVARDLKDVGGHLERSPR